jgi:hypothetical protein
VGVAVGSVARVISRGIAGLVLLAALVACSGEKLTPAPGSAGSTPVTSPTSSAPSSPASSAPVSSAPAGPAAKDGQNYKACLDGTCEVLIRAKAALNLKGDKFTATVANGTLKLTDAKGYISLGRDGSGASRTGGGSVGGMAGGIAAVSWHDAGRPSHTATLSYAEGDTVVAAFTTTK